MRDLDHLLEIGEKVIAAAVWHPERVRRSSIRQYIEVRSARVAGTTIEREGTCDDVREVGDRGETPYMLNGLGPAGTGHEVEWKFLHGSGSPALLQPLSTLRARERFVKRLKNRLKNYKVA